MAKFHYQLVENGGKLSVVQATCDENGEITKISAPVSPQIESRLGPAFMKDVLTSMINDITIYGTKSAASFVRKGIKVKS